MSTPIPQTKDEINKAKNAIWWAGAQTFVKNLLKFRVFSYYFWSGVILLIGGIVGVGTFIVGSPRINDQVICHARRPVFAVSWLWIIIAIIHFLTAWGHAYMESLEYKNFMKMTFQQRAIGFSVKTLPLLTRLIIIYTGFVLQISVLQVILTPECNGKSLQIGLSLITLIHLSVLIFGIVARTKTFITPYIYDPTPAQASLFTQLKIATKAIGP